MSPTMVDDEVDTTTGELVQVGASGLEALNRAEIDVQIATAKQYPRSLDLFQKRAISMATLDDETAESCIYRRPVGKKNGQQEFAEGMSIRMAEIVGASYGNLRVYASMVEQTPEFVRARGAAIDLETNFASSSEVIESTLDRYGKPFSPRMRVVVAKAALAKARRDATFQVVPKALARPVESAVRKILMGSAVTIEKRRANVVAWIEKIGIPAPRVYHAIGVQGPADLTVEKLELLTGIRTALKDGETTLDDAFPLVTPDPAQRKSDQPSPNGTVDTTASTPGPLQPVSATTDRAGNPAASSGGDTTPASAVPQNIGVIVDVDAKPAGTTIKLSTGFRAATNKDDLVRAAHAAKDERLQVRLETRPASNPKNLPILTAVARVEV
jgi:hypothetical protein